MALNGLSPLIVFQLYPIGIGALVSGLIPFVSADTANIVGLPIPVYLAEQQTGVLVESESRAIDVDNQAQQMRGGGVILDQRGINNTVTINLYGRKDSVVLTALLAISDMLFAMAAAKAYKISYFNGPTVVLGGLFHGFTTSTETNTDMIRMTFVISKANVSAGLGAATAVATLATLPRLTAALPAGLSA